MQYVLLSSYHSPTYPAFRTKAWFFEILGEAIQSGPEPPNEGCIPQKSRDAMWNVAAFHQWELDASEEEDERCVGTAEEVGIFN